jgi:uncharacterized membrane-anchored protein
MRGNLDPRWLSVSGATEGLLMLVAFSIVSGVAIAGTVRFFDWIGWGRDPKQKQVTNPIVRAAIAPLLIYAAILLLSWVLPRSWR